MLSGLPFGATAADTAEYMLGDVVVSVVLMESDGSIDDDTEQWTATQIQTVKDEVEEGLSWWTETLSLYSDKHALEFEVDYTYADQPIATGYEPISRPSDDFILWIEDFFAESNVASPSSFSENIRQFNHQQRLAHDADWAFTIFVVNAEADPDDRFDLAGSFRRAFSYAGGRFFVMPHSRPASTVAHETGHMFWAFDEYASGEPYASSRGYYNVQNTNGAMGNPHPEQREVSIMDSPRAAYDDHLISRSAAEIIGWRDSDGDGIFDVLDVPHTLSGTGSFDELTRTYHFVGNSSVQTLTNQNSHGTGGDITLNRITQIQYRVDDGAWQDLARYDDYTVQLDVTTPPLPVDASVLELRTLDERIGVSSETVQLRIGSSRPWQNSANPLDVSGDGDVSPLDALLVIIELNRDGDGEFTDAAPPFVDVSGDGVVSPRDALLVINYLNQTSTVAITNSSTSSLRNSDVAAALAMTGQDEKSSDFWNDDQGQLNVLLTPTL